MGGRRFRVRSRIAGPPPTGPAVVLRMSGAIGGRRNLVRIQNGRATVKSDPTFAVNLELGREIPERNWQ